MRTTDVLVAAAYLIVIGGTTPAIAQCCGDCNQDGRTTVDEIVTAVTRALTGCRDDGVCADVADCGNGVLDAGEQCDFGTLTNTSCISLGFSGGTLQCGAHCVLDTRGCTLAPTATPTATPTPLPLVDNGDGTITDPNTGLMWEKKSADSSIHFSANYYTWSATGSAPDGMVFTEFLAILNTPPCFAGYCDWRLPSSGGSPPGSSGEPAELESILLPDCATASSNKCVGPIFDTDCAGECSVTSCSCTFPDHYWSATTAPDNPNQAWMVHFEDGSVVAVPKTAGVGYVRAVRDGF